MSSTVKNKPTDWSLDDLIAFHAGESTKVYRDFGVRQARMKATLHHLLRLQGTALPAPPSGEESEPDCQALLSSSPEPCGTCGGGGAVYHDPRIDCPDCQPQEGK